MEWGMYYTVGAIDPLYQWLEWMCIDQGEYMFYFYGVG